MPGPAPVETPQVAEKHTRKDDDEVELQDTAPALESEPAKQRLDDEQEGKQKAPKAHKVKSLSVASDDEAPAPHEDAPAPDDEAPVSTEPVVRPPAPQPGRPADHGKGPKGDEPQDGGPKGKRPKDEGPGRPGDRPQRTGDQRPGRNKD